MTGGGVYPALAVLQSLKDKTSEVLWVGSRSGMEESLLAGYDLPYQPISGGGVHGMSPLAIPKNTIQLLKGWRESKRIIAEFNPDVCFYTGGYIGVPMAFASREIPSVVFVPDIEPGLALKLINSRATRICISTEKSRDFLPGQARIHVTGYPLREEITTWTKEKARVKFGITESEKVLLVYGGSKGAQSINHAFLNSASTLLEQLTVIHITGEANFDHVNRKSESIKYGNYHVFSFLHEDIGAAFAAADLAVCRAGASTLGELPHFGLPAILVPYPHAWKYQRTNAEYLVTSGGAVMINDSEIDAAFAKQVPEMILNGRSLSKMSTNIKKLSTEDAAGAITRIIQEAAGEYQEEKTNV